MAKDERKTKAELIDELDALRDEVARLQQADARHQRTERALSESEKRFRTLTASFPNGCVRMFDRDLRYTIADGTALPRLGLTREALVGKTIWEVLTREECDLIEPHYRAALEGIEHVFEFETRGRVFEIYTLPIRDESGRVTAGMAVSQEITERKRADAHIRSLTKELIKAQDDERRRISRDLHDNLAQDLFALRVSCDMLFARLHDDSPTIRRALSNAYAMLDKSIETVRDLAHALSPPGLDELGLVRTLDEYCRDVSSKETLNVHFDFLGDENVHIDFEAETNIFHVVQEAINNAIKHAHAANVNVELEIQPDRIDLSVRDDGSGFDANNRLAAATREKRMGLRNMSERIELLGGKLDIESQIGAGTHVSATIRLG